MKDIYFAIGDRNLINMPQLHFVRLSFIFTLFYLSSFKYNFNGKLKQRSFVFIN